MSVEQYRCMCTRILQNERWHRTLEEGVIQVYQAEFKQLMQNLFVDKIISKETRGSLIGSNLITPTFNVVPKIHNNQVEPPGRPIISGIGSYISHTSVVIDDYLRPHVTTLPY